MLFIQLFAIQSVLCTWLMHAWPLANDKKVDYRIIEHDGCGDCGSPKDEHLITNTLHVFSNLTKSLRQMLTCLYILCSWLLYLKYRLQNAVTEINLKKYM